MTNMTDADVMRELIESQTRRIEHLRLLADNQCREIERLKTERQNCPPVSESEYVRRLEHEVIDSANEIKQLRRKLEEYAVAMKGWRGALAYRDDRIEYLERRLKDVDAKGQS